MATELDLSARVSRAKTDYEVRWKPVDSELYELCRRRPSHDNFADVFTKVAIVGRVYQAGIARAWRGRGDPETEVTQVLMQEADRIERGLQRLGSCQFDRQAAAEIVTLHGDVTGAIHRSGKADLTSFVSKYLHFHSAIVPIFDSIAQTTIGRLVDWKLVGPIREVLISRQEVPTYRNFVAAFVSLHERAYAETTLRPTVKELDHLLWQASLP